MGHVERMQKKKEVIDLAIANANIKRGVLIVLTGNGKGKSSSAFGMVGRSLGKDMKVGVIQFIKSRTDTGEEEFYGNHPNCKWRQHGDGFTWDTQDKSRDIETAKRGWEEAKTMLTDPSYNLVVLDELTYLLSYKYLDTVEVLNTLQNRPVNQHCVVTGRAAIQQLIDLADTVSEVKDVKHAYRLGIEAQPGIDF